MEEVPRDAFEAEHGKEEVADWEQEQAAMADGSRKIPSALLEYYYVTQEGNDLPPRRWFRIWEASTDPMFPDLDKREVQKRVVRWAKS